jgi:hypothetical protein
MTTQTTEPRQRKRVNLTLAPSTVSTLADTLNASRYVDRLVRERQRAWRTALAWLRGPLCGLTLEEINTRVNDPACKFDTRPTGRRLQLLADELDAGNHAVHVALMEDEDCPAPMSTMLQIDPDGRHADFIAGPGYERARRLRREGK